MSFSEHYDLSFTLPQHNPDSESGYQWILAAQRTIKQFETNIFSALAEALDVTLNPTAVLILCPKLQAQILMYLEFQGLFSINACSKNSYIFHRSIIHYS